MLDLYKKSLQDAKPDDEPPPLDPRDEARQAQQQRLKDAVAPTTPGSSSRREETPDVDDAFVGGFYGNRERAR